MSELVLKDANIKIGTSGAPTTTLSDHLRSVTINYNAELKDKTAMGSDSRQRIAGLKDASVMFEFNQDFASTDIEKFFWNQVGAPSSNSWLQIKPTTSTGPRYHGRACIEGFSPVSQGVGDLATFSVTYQMDGDLTRSSATA